MAPEGHLNDATINFFVCNVGISFSLAGLTGVYEIFKQIETRAMERRLFNSITLISLITSVGALLPLALNETELYLIVSSYWLLSAGMLTFGYLLYQLLTGQVRLIHRWLSIVLFAITGSFICLIPVNAHAFNSIIIYKLFIMWGNFILGFRFFLFVRYIVHLSPTTNQFSVSQK